MFDVYDMRTEDEAQYNLLGSIVTHKLINCDYAVGAHELAHLMGVEHDDLNEGTKFNDDQCYALMQEKGSFCRNCINWSETSRDQLQLFVSSNTNRCFLLNRPRSLYLFGTPMETVAPSDQCQCYGFRFHYRFRDSIDAVNPEDCDKKIMCSNNKNRMTYGRTPAPIDGTLCGRNMVCWNRECQSLQ
ncbi:hypothetical protein PV327_004207 [Microctonus hyperodae]|uniref:Peptidase M12B domain-containing protein n=1 Tax=Microctonus hyperodae TaxID=165561 RepID=A0AA39FBW9_MICHY|nr:hypothetical protein PV327_004207 [Microctonus hyperodae]